MSKQSAGTKSVIRSARTAATPERKKTRAVKAAKTAKELPPASVDFWQGYEEWQPIKASPAKRHTYIPDQSYTLPIFYLRPGFGDGV